MSELEELKKKIARLESLINPHQFCDFCAKRREDVKALIAGRTSYICNECVFLCVQVLAENGINP